MVVAKKAHAVYKMGGRNNVSYGVTIPMEFARELGFDDGEKHFMMIRFVKNVEDGDGEDDYPRRMSKREKRKGPYLIMWKIED